MLDSNKLPPAQIKKQKQDTPLQSQKNKGEYQYDQRHKRSYDLIEGATLLSVCLIMAVICYLVCEILIAHGEVNSTPLVALLSGFCYLFLYYFVSMTLAESARLKEKGANFFPSSYPGMMVQHELAPFSKDNSDALCHKQDTGLTESAQEAGGENRPVDTQKDYDTPRDATPSATTFPSVLTISDFESQVGLRCKDSSGRVLS